MKKEQKANRRHTLKLVDASTTPRATTTKSATSHAGETREKGS
jgi:hypothetical protein